MTPHRYRIIRASIVDAQGENQPAQGGEYVFEHGTLRSLVLSWLQAEYRFRPVVPGADGRYAGSGIGTWDGRPSQCRIEDGVLGGDEEEHEFDASWWEGEGPKPWHLHFEARRDSRPGPPPDR